MGCGPERTLYSSPNETDFIVCPECGMKIRKGGKFCTNCGTLLQKDLRVPTSGAGWSK